jgi:prolyl oligopeptidase
VQPVVDNYFGTKVSDPYRSLENTKDPSVQAWMKAQATYTRSHLDALPGRAALLADIEKYGDSTPAVIERVELRGGRYFYTKRNKGEPVPKLYVRDSLNALERLLLDPNEGKASSGTHFAIQGFESSWDGKWVALAVEAGGSEDSQTIVLDVATAKPVDAPIVRTRFFAVSWLPDNSGFLFNQLQEMKPGMPSTEMEQRSRVFLHRLHTAGPDHVIFGNGVSPETTIDPLLLCFAGTEPDSQYVIGTATTGVSNISLWYLAPLDEVLSQPGEKIHWTKLADLGDEIGSVTLRKDVLFLTSAAGAPNFRVLGTTAAHPDLRNAQVVIGEQTGSIYDQGQPGQGLYPAADALYVTYLEDGLAKIRRLEYQDGARTTEIPLPYPGSFTGGDVNPASPGMLMKLTSWVKYGDIYAYSPKTEKVTSTGLQPQGPYDNPTDLAAEEVEVTASDGVKIPLSIVHRKDIPLDGKRPTILYGYGAYGVSTLPEFSADNLAWYSRGGVRAFAHIRGGGERGEPWHLAGYKATKPNTWKDGIACAEYLIAKKYTSSQMLGILGGSAGGIFVGRSITERPDLFAVGLDLVPISDTLRVELTPNGVPNVEEFGSVKTEEGFKALYAMSAYHHVKPGTAYPAMLITTGANDPRVDPSQPVKMAAALQAATSDSKLVMLRVDYDAGHGFGSTKKQQQELEADMMSFALWQFGDPAFQPKETRAGNHQAQ